MLILKFMSHGATQIGMKMYLHADFREDDFGQKTPVGAMIILRGSHTDVLRIGINIIMVYFSRERL